jgi:bacteriocin biosynthesis cyclodehydratase domain-containing protein
VNRFRIPPYLSVMALGGDVLVGLLPPRAVQIEDAPGYLPGLLAFLSSSRSFEELAEHAQAYAALSRDEVKRLLDELLAAGVVSTAEFDADSRYARHLLYYDLLGLDGHWAQRRLGDATVGLVGMGGIGSGVATLLAAAGVGTLVCSDGDTVEVSNLTRQTLYAGDGVGRAKVEVAAARLTELNPEITVRPVRESIAGSDLYDRHFADCELVILSADSPPDVHTWTNDAAFRHGFATSNAGYIESYGVIGPLVLPGRTACYECLRSTGDLQTPGGAAPANLNAEHRAPSFGPLNSLVSAVQANEAIRHLLGLHTETESCRILVDSASYELHRERFARDPECHRCASAAGREAPTHQPEPTLADVYAEQREDASQNAIVLDDLVARLVPGGAGRHALDLGCGTGEQTLRLARAGTAVVATDISIEMLSHAAARAKQAGLGNRVTFEHGTLPNTLNGFDDILCLNVLDHVEQPLPLLDAMRDMLADGGRILLSLPHPVKDQGAWRKEHVGGRWRYREFVVHDYFDEGPVTKSREDPHGEIVIAEIRTFHRTTATWVQLFSRAGLLVTGLWEPAPDPRYEQSQPILYEKSSRIPYFQVFELISRVQRESN